MSAVVIGVISDTHGLLRPEALQALAGVSHIIHVGDSEDPKDLETLRGLAPVSAVRGNCDRGAWAKALPEETIVCLAGCHFAVLHDLQRLTIDPAAATLSAVISGHTHLPMCERREGILHLNPGSAGPHRHGRPVSVGRLLVEKGEVRGEIVMLEHRTV